ncbi:MAG: hypothetical protein DRO40_09960 [Thermoprotei archaeon]|nr:MAG: hypothetical protein DRO40_09960 [Thermoprotei archaeon]
MKVGVVKVRKSSTNPKASSFEVTIPKIIANTLDLKEGEALEVYFSPGSEEFTYRRKGNDECGEGTQS